MSSTVWTIPSLGIGVPHRKRRPVLSPRVAAIVERLRAGDTLERIGQSMALTREGVRQLGSQHPDYKDALVAGARVRHEATLAAHPRCVDCGGPRPVDIRRTRCTDCSNTPWPCACGCGVIIPRRLQKWATSHCKYVGLNRRETQLALYHSWSQEKRQESNKRHNATYTAKHKADPVWRAEYLAQHRISSRAYYYRKKAERAAIAGAAS